MVTDRQEDKLDVLQSKLGALPSARPAQVPENVGAVLSCVDQGITDPRHDSRAVEGILVSNARQAIQVIGYREWNAAQLEQSAQTTSGGQTLEVIAAVKVLGFDDVHPGQQLQGNLGQDDASLDPGCTSVGLHQPPNGRRQRTPPERGRSISL